MLFPAELMELIELAELCDELEELPPPHLFFLLFPPATTNSKLSNFNSFANFCNEIIWGLDFIYSFGLECLNDLMFVLKCTHILTISRQI